VRSRSFLENAIQWKSVVKKYRSLKEATPAPNPKEEDVAPQLVNPLTAANTHGDGAETSLSRRNTPGPNDM